MKQVDRMQSERSLRPIKNYKQRGLMKGERPVNRRFGS